jgi:type VI secretion system protein ImpF
VTGSRLRSECTALLFDRLAPADASAAPDGPTTPAQSIARELERLFNTRTPAPVGSLDRRPATVMDYGIPDLSLFPAADADAHKLLVRHLTRAIELWEPRLRSPSVVIERVPHRADALAARVTGNIGAAAGAIRLSFELTLTDEAAIVHAG